MSFKITSHVWALSKAKNGARLVLLAIAEYANEKGIAWPGIPALAKKTLMTHRNTQRAIRHLVAIGELLIEERKGPSRTHLYRVILEEEPKSEGCQDVMVTKRQDDISDKGTVTFQPYDPSEETVIKKEVKKEIVSGDNLSPSAQEQAASQTIEPQFEELCKLYPFRDGKQTEKGVALKKFRELPAKDRQDVLVAVKHYAESGVWAKDLHRWLRTEQGDEPWREWIKPTSPAVAPQKKCKRNLRGGQCEEDAMPGAAYCEKHNTPIVKLRQACGMAANCAQ